MSRMFWVHALITLLLILTTWITYAFFTSPKFRRQVCFWKKKKEKKHDLQQLSSFNPIVLIRWLLVVAFVSITLLFGYIALLETERNNWFTAIFAGVMNAGWMFSFGAPLYEVWDYVEKVGLILLPLDRAWIAFIAGVSPVLTLCTAVTLFRLPQFWGALLFQWKRDIIIFSDLNERAQKYANALKIKNFDKPPYIVFCSDGRVDPLDTSSIVGQNLVLKQNICNLHLPHFALRHIHFYLVTDNDNVIIEQTICLQEKYERCGCRINCVTSASFNEHIVDQINQNIAKENSKEKDANDTADEADNCCKTTDTTKKKDDVFFDSKGFIAPKSRSLARKAQNPFINVINEPVRVVYHSFHANKPLINQEFLKKLLSDRTKAHKPFTVKALVLGAGPLGEEIARTLLWYCQLPNIHVEVTVAAKEDYETIRGRVYRKNLHFDKHLESIGYKEYARLLTAPNIDLCSIELEKLLASSEYHFIFVATGDDSQNYQLAMRIRRYYLRKPSCWGCPDIRSVIWNDPMTNILHKQDTEALKGVDRKINGKYTDYALLCKKERTDLYHPTCAITLLGSMEETLDTAQLEYEALRYHFHYSNNQKKDDKKKPISIPFSIYSNYFASSESDKRSNWALAIHGKEKYEWFVWNTSEMKQNIDSAKKALAQNEHVRWCIFKLLEGDCPVPEKKIDVFLKHTLKGRDADSVRGFHATLRNWGDLVRKADEQQNAKTRFSWEIVHKQNEQLVTFSLKLNKKIEEEQGNKTDR